MKPVIVKTLLDRRAEAEKEVSLQMIKLSNGEISLAQLQLHCEFYHGIKVRNPKIRIESYFDIEIDSYVYSYYLQLQVVVTRESGKFFFLHNFPTNRRAVYSFQTE